MRALISKFLADRGGATAIEYCLIASGIALVILVAVNGTGTALSGKFNAVSAAFE